MLNDIWTDEEKLKMQLDKRIRIGMLGAGAVGKTSITIRMVHKVFVNEYDPTIEYGCYCSMNINGNKRDLDILDAASCDWTFNTMLQQYRATCDGFALIYMINSNNSFNHIKDVYQKLLEFLRTCWDILVQIELVTH